MAKRWSTGWVVLAGTTKTPGPHQHRPHPDRAESTFCDRVIPTGLQPARLAIPGVPFCRRCETIVAQRARAQRSRNRRRLETARREAQRRGQTKITDTDAYDRSKNATQSIRTASGGLPGLGRRN